MQQEQESLALKAIRNDLAIVGKTMREFSAHVINEDISRFPVYVAFQDPVAIGKPFLTKEKDNLNWNYNVTILEDFIKRGVVVENKVEEFIQTFGDPEQRACIFIVLPAEGGFVFVPYDVKGDDSRQIYDALPN